MMEPEKVEGQQPQELDAPEPSAGTQNTDTKPAATEDKTVPYERFAEVNKRMRDLESKIAEQEAQAAKAEEAKLTEQQKWQELAEKRAKELEAAQQQAAEFQATMRRTSVLSAIEIAARDAGFADPGDAHAFVNVESIEIDDNGKPHGVAELVKKLAKDKPYLVQAKQPAPGNGSGPAPFAATSKATEDMQKQARQYIRARF